MITACTGAFQSNNDPLGCNETTPDAAAVSFYMFVLPGRRCQTRQLNQDNFEHSHLSAPELFDLLMVPAARSITGPT